MANALRGVNRSTIHFLWQCRRASAPEVRDQARTRDANGTLVCERAMVLWLPFRNQIVRALAGSNLLAKSGAICVRGARRRLSDVGSLGLTGSSGPHTSGRYLPPAQRICASTTKKPISCPTEATITLNFCPVPLVNSIQGLLYVTTYCFDQTSGAPDSSALPQAN